MSSPYRVPSPPEAELPESEHPYERVLRAQQRRARLVAAAAMVAAASGLVASVITRSASATARRAEAQARASAFQRERYDAARAAIDTARARALEAQARFERGMEEARAKGDAALSPCPAGVSLPTGQTFAAATRRVLVSVVDDAAHGLPSRTVDEVLVDARRAEIHVNAGRYEDAITGARALTSPSRFGRELVVVTTAAKTPEVTSATTFVPGEVHGRAYLWDFQSSRVLCAADVHATSSREIGFTYAAAPDAEVQAGRTTRLLASLSDDLATAVERAATTALFAR